MQCPYCNSDSQVMDSRITIDAVRRRRMCNVCKRRFTTYEKTGAPSLRVVKRSGKPEQFDTEKLQRSLARVCRSRVAVTVEDLRRVARDIEAQLIDDGAKSVTSGYIATLALERLREIDRVAYNRLAANYIDEDGVLRIEGRSAAADVAQLGLFAGAAAREDGSEGSDDDAR